MKKVTGRLTAGMFAIYEESVKLFSSNDQGFLFMNQRSPAYWKKNSGGCFSNCETIRLPYIFLTLSLDDLWWNELVEVISKLNNLGLAKEKN